jgi:hypothetical protein
MNMYPIFPKWSGAYRRFAFLSTACTVSRWAMGCETNPDQRQFECRLNDEHSWLASAASTISALRSRNVHGAASVTIAGQRTFAALAPIGKV